MKRPFILRGDAAHSAAVAAWQFAKSLIAAGDPVRMTVEPIKPTRTIEQNEKMWAVLTDISRQVQWLVDGKLSWVEPEDWKHILSAGLKRYQRVAQGIGGGFVILGQRTSKMTIAEMSDLIELAQAFGAERGVVFGDQARAAA